ncbi:glucosaminidase domain-containing protein [Chitinophaga sedimenti]|uniref:glucosaminidase domain-containing protein n=1 Tax=Chitinophaga sedimenti TaxID=2033606 RepID=UPI002005B10B|nr:glucosaminidase domain-containing protein [Chitinophaga sedimenti]MCK7559717.1 glucosaminidase domain-containing protein [Chitinophaga sedimenti]
MQVRKYLLLLCFLICASATRAQTIATPQYISNYKGLAMSEMQRSGVPAAIKLAQGIIETQSGNSWLVQNSNNHFGIKCKNNWSGATVNYDDDEKQECFRKYAQAADSWKDHSDFLRNNPRYAFLFEYDPKDYKSRAYGLKQAGYATSRTYPQQLIEVIERYDLNQYTLIAMGDKPADNGPFIADNQPVSGKSNNKVVPAAKLTNYPSGEFKINGRKVMYAPAGTSLVVLANDKDIRVSNLVHYNDLQDAVLLEEDMLIFLQRKNRTGANDYHIVAQGETLHSISQAEGIMIEWLRKRNKLEEGEEPAPGEKLLLDGYAKEKPQVTGIAIIKEEDQQPKDLSLKKIVRDVRGEINKAREGSAAPAKPGPSAEPADKNSLPPQMVEDLKKIDGAQVTQSTMPVSRPATPTASVKYHTVQGKETMYAISKKYNVSVAQLQRWNNLPDNNIKAGQQLVVSQ